MTHHDDTWIRTGALLAGLGVAGYYGARWLTAAPPAAAATLPPSRPTAEPRPMPAISPAPRHLPIIDVGPVTSPDQGEAPPAGTLPRHFDPIFERHRGSIPIEFLRALAMRESGMNPSARGTAAWGLLQIVEVVRHAFNQAHGTHYTRAQLLDPEVNVPIAAWLLRRIVDGYQRHHADVANLRTDWRNPRFVELVVFGWNAGMSEAAGVGRVVEYLKRRGIRAIDLDLVHEHAQAAGASRHLSNAAKVRWSRSVADLYAQERGFRNASWWAVKTPGVILAEMNITNADVSAIGRDIYATFRQPWEAEYDKARARFRTERGRDPGVGKDSDPAAEWATVYGWMTPRPSAEDIRWKTYQGRVRALVGRVRARVARLVHQQQRHVRAHVARHLRPGARLPQAGAAVARAVPGARWRAVGPGAPHPGRGRSVRRSVAVAHRGDRRRGGRRRGRRPADPPRAAEGAGVVTASNPLPLVLGAGGLAVVGAWLARPGRASVAAAMAPPVLREPPAAWVFPVPALGDPPRRGLRRLGLAARRRQAQAPRRRRDVPPPAHAIDQAALYPPGTPHGSLHYFMPDNVPALAIGPGLVTQARRTPRGGTVTLRHADGWTSYYTHLASLAVALGQVVAAGDALGTIGGDPTDPRHLMHLHLELWADHQRSRAIDPGPWLRRWRHRTIERPPHRKPRRRAHVPRGRRPVATATPTGSRRCAASPASTSSASTTPQAIRSSSTSARATPTTSTRP
jgi:hypothetical protein